MNVKEFIKQVLVEEIKSIQQVESHHYLSFGLISQGIEFLGACLDNNEFFKENKSRTRYNKAIRELFPSTYHRYVGAKGIPFNLYDNLRCGILHIFIPRIELELIQESEKEAFGNHLEIKEIRGNQRLILVSQEFMHDFENACKNIIDQIDNRSITHNKVYKEFLSTEP
jgi:hypothetical protein